jgi:aryl-alcohol dehydrogenase-like predicted oxidoreductase
MEYATLPGTDLRLSAICLGAGGFGSSIARDTAFAILDAFVESGGNCADSAHIYAAWTPGGWGISERTLGAWLKMRGLQSGPARTQFVVGTKGGHPNLDTMQVSRLSPTEITQDLNESLDRLDTEYIDMYWLHRDDPAVPVGEILEVLNQHLRAGRIRAIGASNWSIARIEEAAAYARSHGLRTFCASQIGYSLASAPAGSAGAGTLYMDQPTWEWHRRSGMPVVAYSSQALGFFSGKYRPDGTGPQTDKGRTVAATYFNAGNFGRLARAQALAGDKGRPTNDVALAYLLNQPFPVVAIVGSQAVDQIRASCRAAGLRLSVEEVAWLAGAPATNEG